MNIKDLDLRKLPFNPMSNWFVRDIEAKIPGLKRDFVLPGKKAVYTFIVLLYDPRSPFAEMKDIGLWAKKYEAGEASGFRTVEKDGKTYFESCYDGLLLGKNEEFVNAVVDYVAYVHNPVWTEIVYLSEMLLKYTLDALGGRTGDVNEIKSVSLINNRLDQLSDRVFGLSEETELFKQKLYYRVEETRLKLRPEDYASRLLTGSKLEEDNPYGDYQIEPIRFVGNATPEDE
jgi:hypothetical protein